MNFFTKDRFSWLDGTKCLVTGGAGFIGSNLVERLVQLGANVSVLDDLSSGARDNLKGLDCNFAQGSVADEAIVSKSAMGQEYVFHLAAIPAVPRSIEKPLETAWANIWGTQLILEYARRAGAKRVVYSSSSSAYGGTPGEMPRSENLTPLPLSPYAAQKLSGEYLTRVYAHTMGIDTVSLRYFNIFGPKQSPESAYAAVIPKFIAAALNKQSLPLDGNGTQKRDFTFVDNAVYANLLATRPERTFQGETFNVGCGTTYSLNTLIDEIRKLVGHELSIEHRPSRSGDVLFSQADLSKSQEILDYRPIVAFEDGLKKVFNSLRDS